MSDPREEIQARAKQAWLSSNRKNTVVLGTGGGKSKIAIDLLKELDPPAVTLLTNSELLRDENWKAEFEKFDYPWDKIESECYQTVYKWKGRHFPFVIADEIDFMAEEYAQFFKNNTFDYILGLTGFTTEEKQLFLEDIAPVCFNVSTQEMQSSGMLNKSEFIFIKYPLSKEKLLQQKTKTGGMFLVSENDQYRYYDEQFQKAVIVKTSLEKKYKLIGVSPEIQKDWQAAHWRFISTAAKRKSILNNLLSSVKVVNELLRVIHSKPGNKVMIFSALTKQCDQFPNPFHGKVDEDNSILDKFNRGEITTTAVCKKVSRGANVVGLNWIIKESFDGGETDFQQTHGRLMRLRPDQIGRYVILIPQYEALVRVENGSFKRMVIPTQAQRWADKMTESFDMSNSRTITLDKDYKITEDELTGSNTVAVR